MKSGNLIYVVFCYEGMVVAYPDKVSAETRAKQLLEGINCPEWVVPMGVHIRQVFLRDPLDPKL